MWEDEFDTFYRDAKTYRWLLRKENDGREEKNLILLCTFFFSILIYCLFLIIFVTYKNQNKKTAL